MPTTLQTSTAAAALGVDGVTARYGGVVALDDVSLGVDAGASVGVIGANGAGKSTLLDVICGFHPVRSGSVRLAGVTVTRWSPARRARVGLRRTFQRPQAFAGLSVRDDLRTAADGTSRRISANEVDDVLARFGLDGWATSPAADLPLGTARLLELGRAAIARPAVLMLDEPTSGLTDGERARVADAVRDLCATGTAVVVVEHDHDFVASTCARVVVLHAGRVVADGPVRDGLHHALQVAAGAATESTDGTPT